MLQDNFKIEIISKDLIKVNNKNFRFSGTDFYYATQDLLFLGECISCKEISIYKVTSLKHNENKIMFRSILNKISINSCVQCLYVNDYNNKNVNLITTDKEKIDTFLIFK